MKGVIVQVGEPKSIVLFNSGKISAIPTPAGCHIGMVVTVKLNNKLKIAALCLAAVLLLALGVIIGAKFLGGGADGPLPGPAIRVGPPHQRRMDNMGGSGHIQSVTADQAKNLSDDTLVLLTGKIVQSLGDEKYTFRDSSGEITVEIDRKICRGLSMDISDTVEISGEVDVERGQVVIDVKTIRKDTKD